MRLDIHQDREIGKNFQVVLGSQLPAKNTAGRAGLLGEAAGRVVRQRWELWAGPSGVALEGNNRQGWASRLRNG